VAFEETAHTGGGVYVVDCGREAGPGARVFCELRVAGLEEDLYAVEGADYCFGLSNLGLALMNICQTVTSVKE
jgi:hypothetical protein